MTRYEMFVYVLILKGPLRLPEDVGGKSALVSLRLSDYTSA